MSERNPANGIAEQLLCQAKESTDKVSQFFYLYTAANALYFQKHLRQLRAQQDNWNELRALKRWIVDLPLPALKTVVNLDVVDGMLSRIPFDDQTSNWLSNKQGAVINYHKSTLAEETRLAELDANVINDARQNNPQEDTVKSANRSIAKFIYAVRCNLFHGHKALHNKANEQLIEQCSGVLQQWVHASLNGYE